MWRVALVFLLCLVPGSSQDGGQSAAPALAGVVTDPSGASIPGATVLVTGAGSKRIARTDAAGRYSIGPLRPGSYRIQIGAKGFAVFNKDAVDVAAPTTIDAQLAIATETERVTVEDIARGVDAEPDANGTAIVLGQKELAALSDDPDELQQELQAMAGPAAGPTGGQIYIDGFTGGNMPPKSSILQVRINSNPYAPEFDRPGFGRIEIITKPGSDKLHGQAFVQYNSGALDSRNPLLQQASMPPYKQNFFGFSIGGPVRKQKASFSLDGERRSINENAFVYATTLDSNLQPSVVSEGIVTPQTRTSINPRFDYAINPSNSLTARYQATRVQLDKEGVGDYSLPSLAYNQHSSDDTVQLSETAILNPRAITETRFQFFSSRLRDLASAGGPTLDVAGAFRSGGSPVGNSGTTSNRLELSNISTLTRSKHTVKIGGRLRESFLEDTSLNNFSGTFSFLGGFGPQLDAANQPVPGTSVQLTALEVYQRTLLFEQMGFTAAQIRAAGGGATQFTLNAGTPRASVSQFDIGLFVNDDWRVRPNLTLSYGLRYETQTNIHDYGDWSPRFSVAWGIDGRRNTQAKTVLRAGFGVFYERIAETDTLAALRYNGVTQQSYFIRNPDFFPEIPAPGALGTSSQQQLQYLARGAVAPRTYQASAGIDRQVNRSFRIGMQWVNSRGVHLERQRNINAPVNGVYPFGNPTVRFQTETVGFSRSNMIVVSPSVNYKKLFLFGFYMSSWGKDDNEGLPADPNNLRAEWGPSTFADVRQRVVMGTSLPLPWNVSASPFFVASSGAPYNITTGIDTNQDGFASERPALVAGLSGSSCSGNSLVYAAGIGCLNLAPAAGTPVISRNYGRGPATVALNMRLARTWGFGSRGESGTGGFGPPPGMGGARGGGPSGPPPPSPGGGGPPRGLFGGDSGKRYNLTLSLMAHNILNHPSYGAPVGNLSSPFFGESRSLAGFGPFAGGNTTYNRKIDLQLRFTF